MTTRSHDPGYVDSLTRDIRTAADQLKLAYRARHRIGLPPSRRGEPVPAHGRGEPSDPTAAAAHRHYEILEETVAAIEGAKAKLRLALDLLEPPPNAEHNPSAWCRNCRWKPATHHNETLCEACDRYQRDHDGEPRPTHLIDADKRRDIEREHARRTA